MERVRLAELCAATSLFTDLGTGQPPEHGLRTCVAAMRLADALDLDPHRRGEVFYVSLLRFLGCTADAHGLAELAGGDEVGFLAGMAPAANGSSREEIARMLRLAGAGQPLPRRLRTLARAFADPKAGERLLEAHCEVAIRLAGEIGLPEEVSAALGVGYARWDGRGVPAGVGGTDIPAAVRISIVARDLELWAREAGRETALDVLARRRGRAYDPDVVDAVVDGGVAALLDSDDDVWDAVLALEPAPQATVSGTGLVQALGALGDYADLKMPERSGYSRRIARLVAAAAANAGLGDDDTETLERAARVHDVGVVAVPVGVWRAGPRPGSAGWEQVRLHPHWSARILSRCTGLETVATVAGRHHERLDGSGYPAGLTGESARPSGLLACAVALDELTAAGTADAAATLRRFAEAGTFRHDDVRAVLGAVGAAAQPVSIPRPAGLTEREVDVLVLLARGGTNRQIAGTLGISSKTVGTHVEHIYAKSGVRSRAAATLFAMQHDLVG